MADRMLRTWRLPLVTSKSQGIRRAGYLDNQGIVLIKKPGAVPLRPQTNEASAAPVEVCAVRPGHRPVTLATDKEKCITCCRCIAVCSSHARKFNGMPQPEKFSTHRTQTPRARISISSDSEYRGVSRLLPVDGRGDGEDSFREVCSALRFHTCILCPGPHVLHG